MGWRKAVRKWESAVTKQKNGHNTSLVDTNYSKKGLG